MISLKNDQLTIRFPHLGDDLGVSIDFQRTLRIPDNGQDHHLPPGLGRFPLRHIEDFGLGNSEHRKARGGVIMPMFQTDALWLNFRSHGRAPISLPVALKIGAGKINAVSGQRWSDGLTKNPQDYVVVPRQPWLDGFNVAKGTVRQFVAMPLGQGYTVEEQIDPESDVGGIQIEAIPMKQALFQELIAKHEASRARYAEMADALPRFEILMKSSASSDMGLGMGGSMRQKIYNDKYGLDAWDLENSQRCFVMLANAEQWMSITGEEPPLSPISAEQYSKAGLPWFDYFDGDRQAIQGAKALGKLKSIKELAQNGEQTVWPEEGPDLDYKVQKIGSTNVSDGSW